MGLQLGLGTAASGSDVSDGAAASDNSLTTKIRVGAFGVDPICAIV